jgi:hypothetical protein
MPRLSISEASSGTDSCTETPHSGKVSSLLQCVEYLFKPAPDCSVCGEAETTLLF